MVTGGPRSRQNRRFESEDSNSKAKAARIGGLGVDAVKGNHRIVNRSELSFVYRAVANKVCMAGNPHLAGPRRDLGLARVLARGHGLGIFLCSSKKAIFST